MSVETAEGLRTNPARGHALAETLASQTPIANCPA